MTDSELIEHLHARGWSPDKIDIAMIREACAALASHTSAPVRSYRYKCADRLNDCSSFCGSSVCLDSATPPAQEPPADEQSDRAFLAAIKESRRSRQEPPAVQPWMEQEARYEAEMREVAADEAIKAARVQALEEAAKLVEPSNMDTPNDWTYYASIRAECATAIRRLGEEAGRGES